MTKIVKRIGIVAEDLSDFESLRFIIQKTISREKLPFEKRLGGGCSKLMRKLESYVDILYRQKCDLVVVVHDCDRNDVRVLKNDISKKLVAYKNLPLVICIPIEEIESWFLSDPMAIKKTFNLHKLPKISASPEKIKSPKEFLGKLVDKYSKSKDVYFNTAHNRRLSSNLDLNILKNKCPSFLELHQQLVSYKYKN